MAFKFGVGDFVDMDRENGDCCKAVVLARYVHADSNHYVLWAGRPGGPGWNSPLHIHDKTEGELTGAAFNRPSYYLPLSDPSRCVEQLTEGKHTSDDTLLKMVLKQEAERQRLVDVAGHTLKISVED